uniref:Uncharacterized protein n=1 Tax=Anguilla anguilla TaxID=7936 RepID=A0A0E9W768_ANGAN
MVTKRHSNDRMHFQCSEASISSNSCSLGQIICHFYD